jgi:acetate CoA/acetoacetate CoA-transferase beta subunit
MKGKPKIVKKLGLPITSNRRVDLIVTDMAVIEPTDNGLVLKEVAPGVKVQEVISATEAALIVDGMVPEMDID